MAGDQHHSEANSNVKATKWHGGVKRVKCIGRENTIPFSRYKPKGKNNNNNRTKKIDTDAHTHTRT